MYLSEPFGSLDRATQGVVFKKSQGHYTVRIDKQNSILCTMSNKLRKRLLYPIANPNSIRPHVVAVKEIEAVDPIAIGDQVRFENAHDGAGMIVEVLPRKNKLVRYATGPRPLEQVIVANVDQVVVVFAAAQPAPNWRMLDRNLAMAEASHIPALICITKADLVQDEAFMEMVRIYQNVGYAVVLTSTVTDQGIEEVRERLRDRTSVFVGMSGVGKTSLLNALQPGLGLRVKEISKATGKGKHTTTHLEMFDLVFGGGVVDTPGMKLFGLWNVNEIDVASLFIEMEPYIGQCRFGIDCSHSHEPGCQIKKAVEAGNVSHQRYESYLRLREYLFAKGK
ncbi:putative ribosome biogenesis GTPase RsgA [Reticulibacter mediterranei]|uniref:Small ribosomal subunit biogenesis GTPase RsgA n=1 Tax=Reticulibacter mediterranei TaxID=2778369 RepID=A0A8J3IE41_9CHLR|nr:ribosome small subunit-dependent GTPase A [Reticulibacter mediterranei]GHO90853.1 putative ribosome biogenesis GTPase RsgA [Reticulibacter mediterranei]